MTNKEAADELKCYHYKDGTVPEEIILAIKALEGRPTGEWIEHYDSEDGFSWLTCSRCNAEAYKNDYKYCPQCGARMEAEDDSSK